MNTRLRHKFCRCLQERVCKRLQDARLQRFRGDGSLQDPTCQEVAGCEVAELCRTQDAGHKVTGTVTLQRIFYRLFNRQALGQGWGCTCDIYATVVQHLCIAVETAMHSSTNCNAAIRSRAKTAIRRTAPEHHIQAVTLFAAVIVVEPALLVKSNWLAMITGTLPTTAAC